MAVSPTIDDVTIPYDASAVGTGTHQLTYDLEAILEVTGGSTWPCAWSCNNPRDGVVGTGCTGGTGLWTGIAASMSGITLTISAT